MCDIMWPKTCDGSCTDNSTEADSKYLVKVMFPFGWNETLTGTDNTVKFGWDSWQTMTDSWFFSLHATCRFVLQFETILSNSSCYLKNHCTSAGLVCTYLNAFLYGEPVYESENLNFKFCWQKVEFFCLLSVLNIYIKMAKVSPCIAQYVNIKLWSLKKNPIDIDFSNYSRLQSLKL